MNAILDMKMCATLPNITDSFLKIWLEHILYKLSIIRLFYPRKHVGGVGL